MVRPIAVNFLTHSRGIKMLCFFKLIKNIVALKKRYNMSIVKTIRFNYHYFDKDISWKLPVLISKNVNFLKMEGIVSVDDPSSKVLIGFTYENSFQFCENEGKTNWYVAGNVSFGKNVLIGVGSKIVATANGNIRFGDNFAITAESSVISEKNIYFGKNCIVSWGVLVMDQDGHAIMDKSNGNVFNTAEDIIISDKVWLCCNVTVLKGTKIPKGCVVGAGAVLSSEYEAKNSIIVQPSESKIINNIRWFR